MKTPKEFTLYVLQCHKGDDLYRARAAFKGLTPEQMQREYGQSGQTCAEIIAQYEANEAEVNAAIAWVEAQS